MAPNVHRIDDLRCSDQDRELVAQVLNNAYAEGRLTFEEHTERIAKAYDARTFGDLDALTPDLIARRPSAPAPKPASQLSPVAPLSTAVSAQGEFTGGNAILSTFKPGRIDLMGANVTLNAWLGEVKLDLVDTTFAARETTINVGGLMCDVRLRVPEGVDVNVSHLSTVMGEAKIDGLRPRADGIRINLIGTIFMGEVLVLGPDTRKRNKYEKFMK